MSMVLQQGSRSCGRSAIQELDCILTLLERNYRIMKLFEILILAGILILFLMMLKNVYGSAGSLEQDKIGEIENSTKSLVIACSNLGEADTKYMIFCNNMMETIDKQCEEVSFSFCNTDVFGLQN
jgi:amino acid permease